MINVENPSEQHCGMWYMGIVVIILKDAVLSRIVKTNNPPAVRFVWASYIEDAGTIHSGLWAIRPAWW